MGFPRRYLDEGEDVVLEQRPHWFYLASPAVALALSLLVSVYVSSSIDDDNQLKPLALIPLLLVVLLALLWFVVRYARWGTTMLVVTTERLIHRSGVVSRSGREISLLRVKGVDFYQTLFQRLLGAGDLLISAAGERGQQLFANFPHPEQVQGAIRRQIELRRDQDAARVAEHRGVSPLEQLERLEDLRQRGVISQAEFDVKKTKLLGRF